MNRAILIGHIGKDPEVINLDSGVKISKFTLATNETYKNKQGEKVSETTWHNVTTFGKQAEIIEKYFKKGMRVMVEGKIKNGSYEKEDVKFYTSDIIMNGFEFLSDAVSSNHTAKPYNETPGINKGVLSEDTADLDLPF